MRGIRVSAQWRMWAWVSWPWSPTRACSRAAQPLLSCSSSSASWLRRFRLGWSPIACCSCRALPNSPR
ncbi:MAG: hypothetical protein ACK55Z_31575, partial [bacterium]